MVRTGEKSDRKRCPGSWLRTPCELQPSQGAQTAPHSRGLGGWPGWAGEFVARQPVAAFRSPVVCSSLTFVPSLLTLLGYLAIPTHPGCPHSPPPPVLTPLILSSAPKLPGCKRLHLSFRPSWAAKSSDGLKLGS